MSYLKIKMKLTVDFPKKENKNLKMHKLRHDFKTLQEAVIDVVRKFFEKEDTEYFEKANSPGKKPKKDIEKIMNPKEKGK